MPPYRLRTTQHDGTQQKHIIPTPSTPLDGFGTLSVCRMDLPQGLRESWRPVRTIKHMTGVHFVVWAPNAARGNVLGNFIRWDRGCHRAI
jgi:1,4-alpha-glucan branching enzyme